MGRLRRTLGLPLLLFYGVGVLVGAGIYSILGAAAGHAGGWLWLSLLLAAIPAILAALCYAELSGRYPKAGGSYVFIREAMPGQPWLSFATGFTMAAASAATAATVAIAFAGYLNLFFPLPSWIAALVLLTVCTGLNLAGIRESAWAAVICTLLEVVGLLLVIGASLAVGTFGHRMMEWPEDGGATWTGIATAAAVSFFVYTGFEGLANLAEESKRPARNLPKAMLIGLAITMVLYVLVAVAATSLVEPATLADSESPLATAIGAAHSSLPNVLAAIALFSTGNTALITVVVASRLLFGMAQADAMPRWLALVLPGRRTPWVAALLLFAASSVLLPLGGIALVGSVASLLTLVIFAGVGAALIVVRWRDDPTGDDVFRVPGTVGRVPLIPIALLVSVILLASNFGWSVYGVGGCILLAGILLSFVRSWSRRPRRHTDLRREAYT